MSIKGYKYIANKQVILNLQGNISTILGIMLSIILFTIVGHMYAYSREVAILEAKSITGNYEAIITEVSKDDVNILRSNVLTDTVGVYKNIYKEEITLDDVKKNIVVYAMDNVALNEMFSPIINLSKGRLPENENEIIIDNLGREIFHKDIGDTVFLNNTNYKVVGIYDENKSCNLFHMEIITLLENINIENINAVFNVKNKVKKDLVIREIAENLGVNNEESSSNKELIFNNLLFFNYGINAIDGKSVLISDRKIEFILYLAILVLTSFLIYGSINVSVKERIKQFSILRCIGATPNKIRRILIKESLLLLLYSLVPSMIIGQVICFFISEIVLSRIMNIHNYGLTYKIYFSVLIMVVLLSSISVAIATINPIIRIGKIYPIEWIKVYKINQRKVKKVDGKLIKKIFGYNGELAYKNIKANSKSFFITTIVSVIVLTTFIVFVGYHKNYVEAHGRGKEAVNDVTLDISFVEREVSENIFNYVDKYVSEIMELGIVENIFASVNYNLDGIFKDVELNKWSRELDEDNIYGEKIININGKKSVFSNNISLIVMDDLALNKILSIGESGLTIEDFNNNGVIITNKVVLKNYIKPSREDIFNLIKGEKFNLLIKDKARISSEYNIDNEINKLININKEVKFKYLGSTNGDIIFNGSRYGFSDAPTLIVSRDFYNNNAEIFKGDEISLKVKRINLSIYFNNNFDRNTQIEMITDYSNKIDGVILDVKESNKLIEENTLVVSAITYTVMILTVVIGAINIISNNNINMKNRYQEIGTLLAIGISKKRLKHILFLESIIQWFISSSIALISSYLILEILFKILFYSSGMENAEMPVVVMASGVLFLFIVNILSSYLPIKKLKNKNTIDLIRNNE